MEGTAFTVVECGLFFLPALIASRGFLRSYFFSLLGGSLYLAASAACYMQQQVKRKTRYLYKHF